MKISFCSQAHFHCPTDLLEGRSGPWNRPLMLVDQDAPALLTWEDRPESDHGLCLQLSPAIEKIGSKTKELRVYSGAGGPLVATQEVTHADPYQILSLPLDLRSCPPGGPLTLELRLGTGDRLWLFAPDKTAAEGLEYHVPRLIPACPDPGNFIDRLCSLASVQNFGWKEGCILDALWALHQGGYYPGALAALQKHLDYFGFASGDLVCENPLSFRAINTIHGIECTLPFAHAALLQPDHPWTGMALSYWEQLVEKNGHAYDGFMISSEGAYTVAYPMTVIARLRGEERWLNVAEELILETYRRLVLPDGIYLRSYRDGRTTYRNWARGLAWLLLGHVQTLSNQPQSSPQLLGQFQNLAKMAAQYQREDGLWSCFMDDPFQHAEASGSAGIAAALLLGTNAGFLPESYGSRAVHARNALHQQITSEGFLGNCSQSNKGNEDDQRSSYRVTLPYALGLLGLLEAAYNRTGIPSRPSHSVIR